MSADTAWTRGYIGRLHIGLKLHAMYADGFFYAAEVVGISAFRRHRKAPVKIHYLGYARADDEWVPVGRLRSKILRRATEQPKCLWRPLVRLPSPPRLPPAPVAKAPPLLVLPMWKPFKAPPPRPSPSRRPPSPPPKAPPLLQTSLALAHLLPDEDDVSIVTVAMQASGEDVLKLRIHRTHTFYDLESTFFRLFRSSWFPGPFPFSSGTSVRVVGLHEQGPLDKVLDLLEAAADDRIRIVCVPQDESKCITRVHECYRHHLSKTHEYLVVLLQSTQGFSGALVWIRGAEVHTSIQRQFLFFPYDE